MMSGWKNGVPWEVIPDNGEEMVLFVNGWHIGEYATFAECMERLDAMCENHRRYQYL